MLRGHVGCHRTGLTTAAIEGEHMIKNRSIASRVLMGLLSAGLLQGVLMLLRAPRASRRRPVSPLQRAHPQVPDTGAYTPTSLER